VSDQEPQQQNDSVGGEPPAAAQPPNRPSDSTPADAGTVTPTQPLIADVLRDFLATWRVLSLYSPPLMPQYNGSIEASVGSMKSRTEEHATREGRPTQWSWTDTDVARLQANATARSHGARGPTPDQVWSGRRPLSDEQRDRLQARVASYRRELWQQDGWSIEEPPPVLEARAMDRIAIPSALLEDGYLLHSRRRIHLPFCQQKAANNS
jgi:hypothetical protein